jgi:hypothetical protein
VLRRLFFLRGGVGAPNEAPPRLPEACVVPALLAAARSHFDPAEHAKYLRWRLLYLARHARIGPEFFLSMTSRELDAWVMETSDMLKAEFEQGKKTAAERR